MNDFQKGILTLLRSAVTGEKLVLPESFALEAAADFIKRQHITTLVYVGAVNCGISASDPFMTQLFEQYCKHMMHSLRQMKAIGDLYQAFDHAGIDYLPLKGCNMKMLYPKPELRWMSDADILIRTGQYAQIRSLMLAQGYEEKVESDHEFIWDSKKLHVELHKRLIPSYNKDYYAYFGDGWRLAKCADGTRYMLSEEDAFIFQFVHFAKHYRDGGIGCRYVLDLWIYRRAYADMDEGYIRNELQKLSLLEFYENTLNLMTVWFEDVPETEKSAFITEFVFRGGSWGNAEAHVISAGARTVHSQEHARMVKLKIMVKTIFPAARAIENCYTILKRYPWLAPVIWPKRWIDILFFHRERIGQKYHDLQYVTSDSVENYKKDLRYVGLDFKFEEE